MISKSANKGNANGGKILRTNHRSSPNRRTDTSYPSGTKSASSRNKETQEPFFPQEISHQPNPFSLRTIPPPRTKSNQGKITQSRPGPQHTVCPKPSAQPPAEPPYQPPAADLRRPVHPPRIPRIPKFSHPPASPGTTPEANLGHPQTMVPSSRISKVPTTPDQSDQPNPQTETPPIPSGKTPKPKKNYRPSTHKPYHHPAQNPSPEIPPGTTSSQKQASNPQDTTPPTPP